MKLPKRSIVEILSLLIIGIICVILAAFPLPFPKIVVSIILISIPFFAWSLLNPLVSLYLGFTFAILANYLNIIYPFSYGIFVDLALISGFAGVLRDRYLNSKKKTNISWIGLLLLIWLFYSIIQSLNPSLPNISSWAFTIRTMAFYFLFYFIGAYSLKHSNRLIYLVSYILLWTLIAGLYGLKQYFINFSIYEYTWLANSPEKLELFIYEDKIRPFSLFGDPTTFGIFMACGCTLITVITFLTKRLILKILFVLLALFCIGVIILAGSRTAMILIPFGVIIFLYFKFSKVAIIGLAFTSIIGAGLLILKNDHPITQRVLSMVEIRQDASMQIRNQNRNYIQPEILANPFGQGLGTTGIWGRRFNPKSKLSSFVHDSGFLRIAIEMGWAGLLLLLTIIFLILKYAIDKFFRHENSQSGYLYLLAIILLLQLTLAHYTQESIIQLPINFFFILSLILIENGEKYDDFGDKLDALLTVWAMRINSIFKRNPLPESSNP